MDELKLADIIDTRDEQPPIWVSYPGSRTFRVLVRPIGCKYQEFVQAATELKWDLAEMKKRPEINGEKFRELFGAYVVVDWQGLTVEDLRRLVLIDFEKWQEIKGFKGEILMRCEGATTPYDPCVRIYQMAEPGHLRHRALQCRAGGLGRKKVLAAVQFTLAIRWSTVAMPRKPGRRRARTGMRRLPGR